MGFFDRLDKALGQLGGAMKAPVGLAVDVAGAAWDPVDRALGGTDEAAGRAIGGALRHLEEDVWQPFVQRPLSTVALVGQGDARSTLGAVLGLPSGDVFSPGAWREAWRQSEDVSPGQAIVAGQQRGAAALLSPFGDPRQFAAGTPGSPDFDMTDEKQREEYFSHGAGRLQSGAVDIMARWYLDPTVFAGKAAGAGRKAFITRPITPKTNIDRMVDSGRVGRFIAEVEKRGTPEQRMDWLLRNKTIRQAEDGPALSWLLAHAEDTSEIRDVLKVAALRDPVAEQGLRLKNAQLAHAIDRITDVKMPLLESALTRSNSPTRTAHIEAMQARLERELADNKDLLRHGQLTEAVQGTLTAAPRVTAAQRVSSGLGFDLIQPSRYNAPVRIIKAATTMRAGVVDLQRPDGYLQLQRLMDRVGHGVGPQARLTADEKGKVLTRFAQATTEGEKQAAIQEGEKLAMRRVTEGLGLNPDIADELVAQGWKRRDEETLKLRERAFSGAPGTRGKKYLDQVDIDGVMTRHPLDVTQLANQVALLDVAAMTRVLQRQRDLIAGNEGNLIGVLRSGKAAEFTSKHLEEVAAAFNRTWKPLQLLRGGWPIRVVTDEQMRIVATLGAMSHIPLAAKSLRSGITRRGRVGQAEHAKFQEDLLAKIDADLANPTPATDVAGLTAERAVVEKRIAGLKPAEPDFGMGEITVGGYTMGDAFGTVADPKDVFKSLASSRPAHVRLAEDSGRIHNALRGDGNPGNLLPNQPGYAEAWERAVRDQIGSSPLAQKILAGESDDRIAAWLRRSPEGRELRRRLPIRGHTPELWVGELRQHVDHYLPTDELRQLAAKQRATFTDLQRALPVEDMRPTVHGESLAMATGKSEVSKTISGIVQNLYVKLGSAPTDVLSRHPFFVNVYRKRLTQLVDEYDPGATGRLTLEAQARLEQRAREHALRKVRQTLYELGEESNLAHVMRFVMPFYGAWQEVLTRWLGIAMDNPAALAHGFQAWQAPNRVGLVEEINGEEYITVPMPKWFRERVPGAQAFAEQGVPKKSLNLIMQGEPWWAPGVGPLVQVPVAEFARDRPDLQASLRYFIPFGPGEDALDLMAPAYLRRMRALHDKEGNRVYANTMNRIVIEMETDRRLGKLTLTDEQMYAEARRRTDAFFSLRSVANFILPYSPSFKSAYQFYFDKAREYRDKYPDEWESKFLADFGDDYFAFTESFSKSVNSVSPTIEGYEASKKHADLLAKYPEQGSLILGDEDTGDFNGAVYEHQFRTKVGPGDYRTQRATESPRDAMASIQRREGWVAWRKAQTLIKATLSDRGLDSLSQKGAEDLRAVKDAIKDKLTAEHPAWREDYDQWDSGKTTRLVKDLEGYAGLERFDDRPGWQSLRTYLDARRYVVAALQARASHNLQADANSDLRLVWETIVGRMTEQDLAFEDIHSRWLSNDEMRSGE